MPNIAAIATGNPDFSVLVSALTYVDANVPGSNLVTTLADPATDVTVFAPNNAAFGQLAVDLGYAGDPSDVGAVTTFLVGALPAETLRDVVLYHVSGGSQTAAQIGVAGSVTTLLGPIITNDGPTLIDNEPDLINPSLIATDIDASNGIVHVIDRVLLPVDLPGNDAPSIAGIVAASGGTFDTNAGDFDILLNAAQTAGLVGALDDASADLTAFAPTDGAFVGLAQALGYGNDDEAGAWSYLVEALTLLGGGDPVPLLTTVLTYHVGPESLQASQVLGASAIPTLAGASLGVEGASLVDADPDIADPNIVATDIQASNGIVHVLDGVLLPADLLQSDGSNDVDFIIADDSSNHIRTGRDNDLIDGNGGNDRIYAGKGNDIVLGGEGNDRIYGGRGNDTLNGDEGHDIIVGGRGSDLIDGGGGNDRIYSGSGDDTVSGGEGHDVVYSGWGHDVFVFEQGDGRDTFADFHNGRDKIDLSAYGFADFHDLEDHIHSGWFSSRIDLGDGDVLTVRGLTWWNTSEADFIL